MKKHIGRIVLAPELLAELLQFQGATFVAAQIEPVVRRLEITIEHPDMPEVEANFGDVLPIVTPKYTMEYYPDGSPKGVKRGLP